MLLLYEEGIARSEATFSKFKNRNMVGYDRTM